MLGWNCPIHCNQWSMQLDHLEGRVGLGPGLSQMLARAFTSFHPKSSFPSGKHWEHCLVVFIQLLPSLKILEVLFIVRSWNGTWMERMCFQNNVFWMHSHFGGERRHRWLTQDMCQFLPHARHWVNPGCRRGASGDQQRLRELRKYLHDMVPGPPLTATVLGNQRASPQR